jgi:tetratricopeptide (TPR) repeat protein
VPLLVVATARPELLDRRPGWSGGKRNALTISLSPLGDDDTARLIAELLDRVVLPAETQTTLLDRAGGNPLYAEQFVRMFSERSDGEAELPETVQGIIAARLDLLSPDEKALLQDAAVLGKVFWPGALAAIGEVSDAHVEERLRGLARKEFVRRERRASIAGEPEYAFGHLLVRDVAYNQIPRAARAEKHRLAAGWIDSLARDRSDDRAEMLAHHYASALEFATAAGMATDALAEPARSALREGADRAYALGSHRQADRLYSAALELWPEDHRERPELLLSRAHVRNDYNREVDPEDIAAALGSFLATERHDLAADAQMLLAKRMWNAGHGALAHEHADRALELIRDAPASPAKAIVFTESARLAMLAGDVERAEKRGAEGLEMAERLGLDRLRASVLITLGSLPGDRARVLLERGLALALELNDVQQIQRGYNNLAEELLRFGQVAEARALYGQERRTTDRLGVRFIWQDAMEAALFYSVGEWDRAEHLAESFLVAVESGTSHYLEAVPRFIRALIRYARGDRERALEDAERGSAAARAAGDPQIVAWLAMHATLMLREGRTDEASALADEVAAVGLGFLNYYLTWDFGLAMTQLGRSEELSAHLADADLGQPWLDAGRAMAAGDFAEAARCFAELGVATFEAQARLRAAADLVAAGRRREADEQLSRALAFYRSVGATRYIREGEALLAASA